MKTAHLVFIGIKGSVVALNRATGQQVWATHLKGSDFVNVVLQDGAVLASCYGEIFCLDPLTGITMWHNPPQRLRYGAGHHRGGLQSRERQRACVGGETPPRRASRGSCSHGRERVAPGRSGGDS